MAPRAVAQLIGAHLETTIPIDCDVFVRQKLSEKMPEQVSTSPITSFQCAAHGPRRPRHHTAARLPHCALTHPLTPYASATVGACMTRNLALDLAGEAATPLYAARPRGLLSFCLFDGSRFRP